MKKVIIGLIIVFVILAIAIIVALVILSAKDKEETTAKNNEVIQTNITNSSEEEPTIDYVQEEMNLNTKVHRVDSENEYYTVEACIKNYVLYSKVGNADAINKLSNGVSIFDVNDARGSLSIKEMYSIDNNKGTAYFVRVLLNKNTYYITLITDNESGAFKIDGLSEDVYNNIIQGNGLYGYDSYIKVTANDYNPITHVNMTKSEMAEKYLDSYVQNARYNPMDAYNSLDEEYRNARFGNYQNYLAYLTEANKAEQLKSLDPSSIKSASEFSTDEEYSEYLLTLEQKYMESYKNYTDGNKDYYICIDYYNNYYIFEIDSVMNYKLYLDTYTVDLAYMEEQYESAEGDIKAELNIDKIFEALNNKDYEYVYKKLDTSAINEVFGSYENFVGYMQRNLFDNNKVEYEDFDEDSDDTFEYTLKITDRTGSKSSKTMTISITLGENMEYSINNIKF